MFEGVLSKQEAWFMGEVWFLGDEEGVRVGFGDVFRGHF